MDLVRDTPWHLRQATHSHHRHFEHLIELHRLTETWVRELQAERPSHNLNRGLSREITENLWMLENPGSRDLDAMLDDTSAEDVLRRLERTIWAVQAYTLSQLLERTQQEERAVLDSVLEQSCWKLGREFAERKWARLPDSNRSNLRRLLLAFSDTPFGSASHGQSFLVHRATQTEARIELHHCPHQTLFSEVRRIADELCTLHGHWIRGFAYGLNHRLIVESQRGEPSSDTSGDGAAFERCSQRWCLTHAD